MNDNQQTEQLRAELLDPENIVATALEVVMELAIWWGHARLGLVLATAYFNSKPLTTSELSDVMGWSPETIRRHLKPLINVGRVRVIEEGRNVRYKAKQEWSIKTREMLLRHHHKIRQTGEPVDRRNWVFPKPLSSLNLDEHLPDPDSRKVG